VESGPLWERKRRRTRLALVLIDGEGSLLPAEIRYQPLEERDEILLGDPTVLQPNGQHEIVKGRLFLADTKPKPLGGARLVVPTKDPNGTGTNIGQILAPICPGPG
jgi:hypothetical protein